MSNNRNQRVLYIANPGSDSDGSEDYQRSQRSQRSQAESSTTSQSQAYSYQPPALPNVPSPNHEPTRPLPPIKPSLTTNNLPPENGPSNGYSLSNPNLSSPSSTSSRGIESTPPPSTPGLGGPAVELPQERHEPMIMPQYESHYGSVSHVSPRPPGFLDKIKAAIPHRHSHSSRTSNASHQSNSSPTATTPESYTSPYTSQSSRSTLIEKLLIMVTADADQYSTVEIFGARNAAVIRERIFTKLQISDEDQVHYSIYRHKIGGFAMGDALSDEQLFNLCLERGDDEGSLRFFVSHSSARVHDLSHSTTSLSPTAVSTSSIPPPILPHSDNSYVSLRPQRRHRSGSRHGSVSSASERLPPEVGAGYEASVSDDLDMPDREHRSTIRPLPSSRNAAVAQRNLPTSPDRGPRPGGPMSRPKSPLYRLRTVSPSTSSHDLPSEVLPTMVDQYGSITPTPPNAQPPAGLTPNRASIDDNTLTPPALRRHVRSGSDAAAEREQVLEASENHREEADKMWQQQRNGAGGQDRVRRDNQLTPDGEDSLTEKSSQGDPWVLVPSEIPRPSKRPSTANDSPRTSPTVSKDRHRNQKYGGYKVMGGLHNRAPHIPNPPRNPPPQLPVGAVDRLPGSRSTPQAVPRDWLVTSVVPNRQDHKATPVSNWNNRGLTSAKSVGDFRSHPTNLQPGTRHKTQTAMNRPPERGISIPNNSYGDGASSASGSYVGGQPKSLEQRSQPRPLPKQNSSQASTPITGQSPPNSYGASRLQSPSSGYSSLYSPGGEPYPRPTSALGSSVTSPVTHRVIGRPYGNDLEDGDNNYSPSTMSPYRTTAVNGRLGYGREEGSSIAGRYALKLNPNNLGSYVSSKSSDPYDSSENPRTPPRSPASPRSPRHSSRPPTAESTNATFIANPEPAGSIEDGINSNETLRPDKHEWIHKILNGNDSATVVPKSVDIGQSPGPVTSAPSLSLLPPQLPLQYPPSSPSQQTPVDDYSDDNDDYDDSDEEDDLWAVRPGTRSPRVKSMSRRKSSRRGVPELVVQTSTPPTSFRSNIPKGSESATQGRLPPNASRRQGPPASTADKARQRASTFAENEATWAPRPAPEEVYERLEDFFPGHDLDKPVIEASSGAGSPTAAEYPAAPPLPEKDRPVNGLMKAKKSIRIVAEEHKKRIDRTSHTDNFATSVSRKRSTKLWGSRLEEVTTAQAMAEQQRARFVKPNPESPSGSGGLRPIFKWVRGELIGKGTYGRVYLALNATTGEMIAVKQVEIPQTASDKNDTRQAIFVKALKSESETLKDLDHPNVVQYLGFEETPNFLSIFLEYVPGGSIGSCLLKHGKFNEEVTKSFTEQILTGLEYLHSKGILHRDLKADNILVETSGICKISDFGISKRTDDMGGLGASTAMQGTIFWMAPEVIDTSHNGYDKKIDIWSVGCVVLEMWAGKRPWSGDEAFTVILKLHKNKLPPPIPDDVDLSELALDFRSKCFAINPEERPNASELRKHPYLILPEYWQFNGFSEFDPDS